MPGPFYLPPGDEILQGDIYKDVPSVYVETKPLRAARLFEKRRDGREVWSVHADGVNPPKGDFKWRMDRGGESSMLVHGYVGLAVLLSHDCEIENDPTTRTLAIVRPAEHLDAKTQEDLFGGADIFTAFPLEAQDEEPRLARSFVDFRRLTTVRPELLKQSVRIASLTDELRKAMARRFWEYLFRRVEDGGDQ